MSGVEIRRRSVEPGAQARLAESVHPVLARAYAGRSIRGPEEIDYSLARLAPFHGLLGMDAAVSLLEEALRSQWRTLVVGDFDADGATSTAVALRALRAMGAAHVDYLVPNRFDFGYGLTPEIVAVARERGPALIITVDNGIASNEGVDAARAAGIRVLVTDHHLPGPVLPAAEAIVNPNRPGDGFPSKHLAGVGVVFYLMLALRSRLRECGWFVERGIAEPNLGRLLGLVALGTVADVVCLDRNNRILVAQGLGRIRSGPPEPGIRALLRVGGRDPARATASDLAFAVAPRLNAAGRLTDMSLGIACLLSDEAEEATLLARDLDRLNAERRGIETRMRAEAAEQVEALVLDATGALPHGICLFDGGWHPGVVGIIAARVKDRVNRPVVAFAPDGAEALRGSARSLSGLHVRDAIEAVATSEPGLVLRFGGHAMAAGLTIARAGLDRFRAGFDAAVRARVSADDLAGHVVSDGELDAGDLELEVAEAVRAAGPWGSGFPEPVFDGYFDVVSSRVVGERHLKLGLAGPGRGDPLEAIAFAADPAFLEPGGVPPRIRLVYRLDVNEYRGERRLQLLVDHLEPAV